VFSIWLTPSKKSLIPLMDCINNNSFKLGRPGYIPHMTLFFSEKELESASKQFDIVASKITVSAIKLQTVDIVENEDSFYMGLYLSLKNSADLITLFNNVSKLDTVSNYKLCPHVSLAYGIKGKQYNSLFHYKPTEIIFDTISIINCKIDESNASIASWEILKSYDMPSKTLY
jgi:hypothetical protein